jgi:hypothetical protein
MKEDSYSPHLGDALLGLVEKKIIHLFSLPERRASKTPTIEQVLRLFEHQGKHYLYDGVRLVQQSAEPLTPAQSNFERSAAARRLTEMEWVTQMLQREDAFRHSAGVQLRSRKLPK